MLKTEYMGYQLDTLEWMKERGWHSYYINEKSQHLIVGNGPKPESACADAQKKIQKRVNGTKTTSN